MTRAIFSSFIISLALSFTLNAQNTAVVKATSDSINQFANSIRNIEEFVELENCCIGIKIIECGNQFGSFVGEEGKDIVFFDLHISIKQIVNDNEKSTYGVYWVKGKYHNPRKYNFESQKNRLTFIHGTENNPIKISMILSATGIELE